MKQTPVLESSEIPIEMRAALVPLARLLSRKGLRARHVKSRAEFVRLTDGLGREDGLPFEFHITRTGDHFRTIRLCLNESDFQSAMVLLFNVFEAEVNQLIRIGLSVRDFSYSKIDIALKEASFAAKLDITCQLLGFLPSQRLRNAMMGSKGVRNTITHNKMTPSRAIGDHDYPSDYESNDLEAQSFFQTHDISGIQSDLESFHSESVGGMQEIQDALILLRRYGNQYKACS